MQTIAAERQHILGVVIDNLTMDESLDRIASFVASGRPHQHVVVNVDKVVKANDDPNLARIISECDLVNVDGMPVVWASYVLGQPLKERVAGVDLFFRLLGRAQEQRWRVFFLGAQQSVVESVVERARLEYPKLQIAGFRNGYWRTEEEADIAETIAEAAPDILFVAISSPKKEQFLARYQSTMKVPFAMGVGGSFDVMVGVTKRAPVWMQRTGTEWFYRFLQEPRRMFRRYFIEGMRFFGLLAKACWCRYGPRVRS